MSVYCRNLALVFPQHQPPLSSAISKFCTPIYLIVTLFTSPLCFVLQHTARIFVHYYLSAICAGRSLFLFLCSIHYLVFKYIHRHRIFWINMSPKRKATDAGSSTSPLKKRNAVTAGIGRAAEPETNGIGYYGRTDEREDVSKIIPPSLYSSYPVS